MPGALCLKKGRALYKPRDNLWLQEAVSLPGAVRFFSLPPVLCSMQSDDSYPLFWIWEEVEVLLGLTVCKCQFTYSSSGLASVIGCKVVLIAPPLVSQIPGCRGGTGAQTNRSTLSRCASRSALSCSSWCQPSCGGTLGYRKTGEEVWEERPCLLQSLLLLCAGCRHLLYQRVRM